LFALVGVLGIQVSVVWLSGVVALPVLYYQAIRSRREAGELLMSAISIQHLGVAALRKFGQRATEIMNEP
jgi:hypothetical protein